MEYIFDEERNNIHQYHSTDVFLFWENNGEQFVCNKLIKFDPYSGRKKPEVIVLLDLQGV